MRTTVLESIHGLSKTRSWIAEATCVVERTPAGEALYQVRTASCGCVNRTRIVGDRPSCDGVTHLCDAHAIPESDDDC